jgi:hypothetical protein
MFRTVWTSKKRKVNLVLSGCTAMLPFVWLPYRAAVATETRTLQILIFSEKWLFTALKTLRPF